MEALSRRHLQDIRHQINPHQLLRQPSAALHWLHVLIAKDSQHQDAVAFHRTITTNTKHQHTLATAQNRPHHGGEHKPPHSTPPPPAARLRYSNPSELAW